MKQIAKRMRLVLAIVLMFAVCWTFDLEAQELEEAQPHIHVILMRRVQ